MAVEWTLEERKQYLKNKFFSHQIKLVLFAVCMIILIILLFLTGYFLSQGAWMLFMLFLVVLIVSGIIVIFVIDMVFFGAE